MITFTFNGISSEIFNILVLESNHNTKPSKRIEFIEVPGRTGNLMIYDNSRENLEINIQCHVELDRNHNKGVLLDELDTWLNGEDGYLDLIFNNGKVFKAVFIGELYLPDTDFFYTDFELKFSAYEVI